MVEPSRTTVIEFAMYEISFNLCEMMIDVMPSDLNLSISSKSFWESDSFNDAVGSSRINRRQFLEIALAISTSCCLPTPISLIKV